MLFKNLCHTAVLGLHFQGRVIKLESGRKVLATKMFYTNLSELFVMELTITKFTFLLFYLSASII